MTNPDKDSIISEQLYWHSHSKQGCLFASFMSKDAAKHGWKIICIQEEVSAQLLPKINDEIQAAAKDDEIQCVSIILPLLKTKEDLIEFIKYGKQITEWQIDDQDKHADSSTLVRIKVHLNGEMHDGQPVLSWMLGFGQFPGFAQTRQSPHTEITLVVKSKQFLKEKHGKHSLYQHHENSRPRVDLMKIKPHSASSAHLADLHIPGITDVPHKDENFWNRTGITKRRYLNIPLSMDVDDDKAKAKTTFVIQNYSSNE